MNPEENLRTALAALEAHATGDEPRTARAGKAADVIRQAGRYRWVGLYDVTEDEIAVIAWSGPTPPSHPRFPRSHGLNGAAVASRRAVVVQDVSTDPRYLPTLSDTRGELIMPVSDSAGTIIGTIDVESAVVGAFRHLDEVLLEQCARALRPLWETRGEER